jgi:WD40 repeat protein
MSRLISSQNAHQLSTLARTSCAFISRLAWSPDGRMLAIAHGDGVWLWHDGFGGAPWLRLKGHNAPVKDIAFSPDSQVIASASADTTVRLWVAASGQSMHVLRRHTDAVNAVAFSASGRLLASGGGDQRIMLLDMRESAGTSALTGHNGEITSVIFGAGDMLASGGWDKTLRLWDSVDRSERVILPFDDWIRELAISDDRRILAAACKDGTLRLIDFLSGAQLRVIQAHEGGVDCASFSPDGLLLLSGGRDHTLKLWDLETESAQPLVVLEGHTKPVLTAAFHPVGNLIASGSGDNTVRLWGV